MFTDIVGYSAMANRDQEHALELLSTHDSIIEPIISQNGGKIIKKIGDSIFAEFLNPQDSIHTAQKIQSNLIKRRTSPNECIYQEKHFKHICLGVGDKNR